jgi:hypothetical protein
LKALGIESLQGGTNLSYKLSQIRETLRAWECFDSDAGRDIAAEIREYFIPDFSEWIKPGMFEGEFKKLCRDLRKEGVPMRKEDERKHPSDWPE